jgi:hypothetical protein
MYCTITVQAKARDMQEEKQGYHCLARKFFRSSGEPRWAGGRGESGTLAIPNHSLDDIPVAQPISLNVRVTQRLLQLLHHVLGAKVRHLPPPTPRQLVGRSGSMKTKGEMSQPRLSAGRTLPPLRIASCLSRPSAPGQNPISRPDRPPAARPAYKPLPLLSGPAPRSLRCRRQAADSTLSGSGCRCRYG